MPFNLLNLNMLFNGVQTYGNYNPFMSCGSGFTNSIFPFGAGCCNYGAGGAGNKPMSAGHVLLTAFGFGALGVGLYAGISWLNTKIQSKRTESYNNANLSNNIAGIEKQMSAKKEIFDKFDEANKTVTDTTINTAYEAYIKAEKALPTAQANLQALENAYNNNSANFPTNGIVVNGVVYNDLNNLNSALTSAQTEVTNQQNAIDNNKENYEKYKAALAEITEDKRKAADAARAEYKKLQGDLKILEGKQKAQQNQARAELLDEADGNVINRNNTFTIDNNNNIKIGDTNANFNSENPATKADLRGLINLYSHASDTQKEHIYKKYQEALNSNSKLNNGDFAKVLQLMKNECPSSS